MKANHNILAFCMLAVLVSLSAACKRFTLETLGETSSDNDNKLMTLATTDPEIKPLPVVWKLEDGIVNYKPGDHTQHMQGIAYSESDPDRIYMGQDVSNVWVSKDFGENWFTLKNQGLGTNFVTSIEVDPVDKDRILASVNCRNYSQINEDYQGIYLSEDGGITWKQEPSGHRVKLTAVRSSTKLLAYAPTSKNSSYASRWYAAFGEGREAIPADDGLMTSSDGGVTWTEVRKLPKSTFGEDVRGIKVHKTNANQVFLYGSAGLFKITNATSASGTVYKLSNDIEAAGKLPPGDIMGSLYQSNDGNTLIVAVVGHGIYKSTNGGVDWSTLYPWSYISYCYVNENHPNMIFAVPGEGLGQQLKISATGGSSWYSPTEVKYRPGYPGTYYTLLSGDFAYVLSDPRDPSKVFMHSKSQNYSSTNFGRNWTWSDNGFNGSSHSSINADQMFDPVNSDRFCYFMVDKGPVVSTARGSWFKNYVNHKPPGLNGQTCVGGALQPGTGVILATVGKEGTGKLIRSTDNGDNWAVIPDQGGWVNSNETRWVVAFSKQNPNRCYQWRDRSDDGGATWHQLNNMPANSMICGVSRWNGNFVYAIQFGTPTTKIYKSINGGDTWSPDPVIQTTWDLTYPGDSRMFVFKVHPQDNNIVYTSSATGGITKWDLNTSPVQHTDLTIPTGPGANYFHRFAIDPRHPDIMYVLNQRANTGFKFFRSTQGGINGSWENLSDYIPQGSVNGLAVSPVTGEVYISGENGSLVMLPPYTTSNTAYQKVSWTNNHISTFPY